jgi:hypothetical protein
MSLEIHQEAATLSSLREHAKISIAFAAGELGQAL